MATLSSTGRFAAGEACADNDILYGPYATTAAAHAALLEAEQNVVGRTVGIQTGNTIEEHWYQGGTTEQHLVKKQADVDTSTLATKTELQQGLSGKQDTINDLSTIRSGAAAGATAYQKPSSGIQASDLSNDVQTSLGKADTSVQQVTVGTTTTGAAGSNASVTNSGTSTAPVLDFTIPRGADGADAVNPFKGWFNAITTGTPGTDFVVTDEDGNLVEAYPTPVIGDYAYIKTWDIDTTQSPQVETPITKIYECTTAGTWSDSGRTADTSNVQTFASSQQVNDVHIVNDFSGGEDDVASAEIVKELGGYINGTETVTYENQTVESGYFNSHDLTQSGFQMPIDRSNPSGTTKSCMLQVLEGQVYKICGTGGTNDYTLLYVTTDAERHPIRYAEIAYNTRNNPIELTIEQGEARLYCNLSLWQEGDYIEKKVVTENHDGLIEKVQEIEDTITELESSAETLETVTQSNYIDINGIQPLIDTDLVAEVISAGLTSGHPARYDGSYVSSNYFKRYTLDLTGKYAAGYRKVRFYGCQWSPSSNIVSGLIATDIVDNVASVESYVAYYGSNLYYFEAELILTPNSKYLIMTGVTPNGRESNSSLEDIPDLTSVTFLADNDSQGLKQRVTALEENPVLQSVSVDLPDVINAVVGDTLQLYYKSIFRCVNPYIYDIKVTCNIGAQYPRYYELTPTSGQIGNHNITFTIKDNNNNLLGQKQVIIKVCQKVSSPTLNILCVGASNTQEGQWPSELKKRLTTSNGSGVNPPIGFELSNINFVGRMSKTYNGQQVNLEATGGYKFTTYITANAAFVRFFFTQAQVPSGIAIGDKYSDGTTEYTISEINIPNSLNGYYGNINCSVATLPSSVGLNLTRVTGTGDSSITASSSSQNGNPFVHNGVIDIANYASQYCNNQIDVVYTELFGNGLVTQYQEDFTNTFADMQSFIDMFTAVFPSCKFCLNIMQNKDEKGGLGVNYGAGIGAYSYPYGLKYGCHNLLTKLQKYINDNNLGSYVFIVNTLNEFDCENDYRKTVKAVNVRFGESMVPVNYVVDMTDTTKVYMLKQSSSGYSPGVYIYREGNWIQRESESNYAEPFGVNGAHPSDIGYYQMADAATRAFIAHFCQ